MFVTIEPQISVRERTMPKLFVIVAAALALAGCQTVQQDRALTGAAIGGVAGTAIGAVAGRSVGGAVAGGLIGAGAGALIGAATTPDYCYRYRNHRRYRTSCY
jgi:osmotically inducible lipoprotein OsmB